MKKRWIAVLSVALVCVTKSFGAGGGEASKSQDIRGIGVTAILKDEKSTPKLFLRKNVIFGKEEYLEASTFKLVSVGSDGGVLESRYVDFIERKLFIKCLPRSKSDCSAPRAYKEFYVVMRKLPGIASFRLYKGDKLVAEKSLKLSK
jgi:hypothetical protein